MTPLLTFALAALFQGAGQSQTQPPIPAAQVAPAPVSIPEKYTAKAPGPDAAVAKVDGQVIHAKDVDGILWETYGSQLTDDYVNLVIARRAAAAQGVSVTREEVEKQAALFVTENDERLKANPQRPAGVPIEVLLAREGYMPSRIYINAEIAAILDKIAAKSLVAGKYVKLSVMAFNPSDDSAAAMTVASQKATAAAGKLKVGQNWADLLKSSDDPEKFKETDGLLGWVELKTMPPEVQKQLVGIKVGGTTQPVTLPSGRAGAAPQPGVPSVFFEIFKVNALGSAATGKDLDELKEQYGISQRRPLMTDLIKKAKVERFPVTEPGAAPPQAPPKK